MLKNVKNNVLFYCIIYCKDVVSIQNKTKYIILVIGFALDLVLIAFATYYMFVGLSICLTYYLANTISIIPLYCLADNLSESTTNSKVDELIKEEYYDRKRSN